MDVAERARCVAAAEGGLLEMLEERDGLTSCELFFLDRPGPEVRAETTGLAVGRTGDGSREGIGELVAEGARRGRGFLVCGGGSCGGGCDAVEVDDSRTGLGVVDLEGLVLDEAETEGECVEVESGVWDGLADVDVDATGVLSCEDIMARIKLNGDEMAESAMLCDPDLGQV
ncbi:hypothetical protein M7I_3714 [Glarea lozoyensis 74030]|uniref:EF-hand domain-containing protein n=1 Tax=Glarea lozoyensis (strain ATCC 74030 / MF5533) TaxID=1104152 RepID=H0EM84_GLAL7|nr:hypothetical protein M7I_3714 [Glarea lozoyensis 74030]